jgi:hypothetical protein
MRIQVGGQELVEPFDKAAKCRSTHNPLEVGSSGMVVRAVESRSRDDLHQAMEQRLVACVHPGRADPAASWTNGDARSYRYTVTVDDTPAAQGLTASATFSWEARNL